MSMPKFSGNDLAAVLISAFCGSLLSNNSLNTKVTLFFEIHIFTIAIFSELSAKFAEIYTSIHILPAFCRGLCAQFRAVRRLSCGCRLPASRRV